LARSDDLGGTTAFVADYRDPAGEGFDRDVAKCLNPFGGHDQGAAAAELLLELVGVEESGVGDRGLGVAALDLGPVVGMLHRAPDLEGDASRFSGNDGIFEALFGGDTTDPAEVVFGFVAGLVAIEVDAVAEDAKSIAEGEGVGLAAAMDGEALGVALADLLDHLIHGVAEGAHTDEVADRGLDEGRQVEGQPVIAEVEDQIEFGLLFANVVPEVGEDAVGGEDDRLVAALALGGGLEGTGDFDQVEVWQAGAGGGDRGDPVAALVEGEGHVGQGEFDAAAEAGAEGADGGGDKEDALHKNPSIANCCCRMDRAGYTLWGGLGWFSVTLPSLLNDRYRVLSRLAAGGFGETFLAEDTFLPSARRCVVKRLRPQLQETLADRFAREAAILESLGRSCDRVPQLYAYFTEADAFYLVQEWIEGRTLEEQVRLDGPQSVERVRGWLRSLLQTLVQVHDSGVIHRDIKPGNVLLRRLETDGNSSDQLEPILIDFGIAKEGESGQSMAIGTAGFMAPEQAAGKPLFASDLYGLAMTACYGILGELPKGLPVRCDQLNAGDLEPILQRALAWHPTDRYSSAAEMLTDLDRGSVSISTGGELEDTCLPETISPVNDRYSVESEIPALGAECAPLQVIPTQSSTPYPPDQSADRLILINKVRNSWIKGVLETSLHHRAWIELKLEERLDAVSHPWGLAWESAAQSRRSLPTDTTVVELFLGMGQGRSLLILGDPGSGKTTLLLELCRDLLVRAEADDRLPIPVVLNLSSWAGLMGEVERLPINWATVAQKSRPLPIADWIVQELNVQYQVSRDLARGWLRQRRLLLLLDGLDEVRLSLRSACVQAINAFVVELGGTELVVCSRRLDYEALTAQTRNGSSPLSSRLQLQGAVFIEPLTEAQIDRYLTKAGADLAAVRQALSGDRALQELAKSPLMLNIITLAYQGANLTDLPELELDARRRHLFDHYVDRMLSRRSPIGSGRYDPTLAKHWLRWLARRLVDNSQTILLLERIQPTWLPSDRQRWFYQFGLLFCFVLLLLIPGLWVMTVDRLIVCVGIAILIFGPIFGMPEIRTVETLRWSWKKASRSLLPSIGVGFLTGLVFKLIYELILHPLGWGIFAQGGASLPMRSILRGVIFGMMTGLLFAFVRSWRGPGIRRKATLPNQGIWQSAKHGLFFAFFGGVGLGLAAAGLNHIPMLWGTFGWLFGWSLGGGEAFIKHGLLRLLLWRSGAMPWNYAQFLDWATERIFLQKVGGGYIFVHRLLLEHFAGRDAGRDAGSGGRFLAQEATPKGLAAVDDEMGLE
jgi:serine/threonine protein kinase